MTKAFKLYYEVECDSRTMISKEYYFFRREDALEKMNEFKVKQFGITEEGDDYFEAILNPLDDDCGPIEDCIYCGVIEIEIN